MLSESPFLSLGWGDRVLRRRFLISFPLAVFITVVMQTEIASSGVSEIGRVNRSVVCMLLLIDPRCEFLDLGCGWELPSEAESTIVDDHPEGYLV